MASFLDKLPLPRFRKKRPLVTVLRLSGVVGQIGPMRNGMTLPAMAGLIEKAFASKQLSAVALSVNCPGGSPVQSALIAKRIRDLAEEKDVEVYAFTEDVAASGGYWLACAADHIYADESSIVGSIGVISAGFGFTGLMERIGVERRVHTAGDKKMLLDAFREEDPADVKRLKAVQKDIHEAFKEQVRKRRGERLKGAERTLFSGEFWTGRKAEELGLIDGIGELRQVMREKFGEKVRLRRIEPPKSWFRRGVGVATPIWPGAETSDSAWGADWGASLAGGLVSAVEERALWQRYGL